MTNGETATPAAAGDKPPEPRWLFYVLSFIIPLAGIIIGAIYLSKPEPALKKFGKTCLFLALGAIAACCLCYILYIVVWVGIFGLATIGSLATS